MGGKPIKEFIGLGSKMYSILSEAGEQKNTAKGVRRSVSENILTHEDYWKCLFMKKSMKNKMMRFVHEKHELYTVEQNKTSLSPFNDKRYILEKGVSHSFGHYSIDSADDGEDILYDGNQINSCATVQQLCNTCATVQQLCNTCATVVQQLYNNATVVQQLLQHLCFYNKECIKNNK